MKKNSLFLAVAILFCSAANAQLKKGDVMVGANVGNVFGMFEKGSFDLNVSPFAAKFVKDNLAIGGRLNLGSSGAINRPAKTWYGVSALGRYYFGNPNVPKRLRFFGEATLGLSALNEPTIWSGDKGYVSNTRLGLGYGIGVGVSYFVTPNIALEASLKYEGMTGAKNVYQNSSLLSLNVGCSISLPGNKKGK